MIRKSVLALIALSFVMIAAAPAPAALINLVVNGTVSSNLVTAGANSPYIGVPVGTAVVLTVPINTSGPGVGFSSPNETLYNITKTACTLFVAGVGTANGLGGTSSLFYNDGGSAFYRVQAPSIGVPGGQFNQSSVNFRVSGEAGPNPFVNTNPADIFASHGTYFPTAAVFDGPLPSIGLEFYVAVLNNLQNQRMTMNIDSFTITPEPTSLGLLAVAGMMTIVRRRRA